MSILLTFLYMVNCSMSPRSGRMEQFTMYKNVNKIRVNQCHCYQRKSLINCSCHFIFSNFFYLTLSFISTAYYLPLLKCYQMKASSSTQIPHSMLRFTVRYAGHHTSTRSTNTRPCRVTVTIAHPSACNHATIDLF